MGSKIYHEVHENPRIFFSSSSPILLESFGHGSSDWSLPREDCINMPTTFWALYLVHPMECSFHSPPHPRAQYE